MRLIALLATTVFFAVNAAQARDAGSILDANRKASGEAAWTSKEALEVHYAFSGQGMTGKVDSTFDLHTGAFVDRFEIGPTKGANGFDTHEAWMQDMSGAATPQAGGDTRELAINEAYRNANLWWRADRGGALIISQGTKAAGEEAYDVLSVTPKNGKAFQAWFDVKTHLLARIVEPQGPHTIVTILSEPRTVDGAVLLAKQTIDDGMGEQYRQTQTLTSSRFIPRRPASAYAAPTARLTDATILNPAGRTSVPFKLINNHIYAEVRVNGKGPFLCIFDTGGHDLLTPETAKALTVKAEGQAPGMGAGEGVVDTSFTRGVSFQVGDLLIKNQTISVLPFGSKEVDGLDEQGMIGFEVFRRFVTEIDYGKKILTFIDPERFDPKEAGTAVPFVFYSHSPQVRGNFEGVPGVFNIDTGSRVELTLTKPFADAHHLMEKHPKGVLAVDGWGVGGRSISYVTRGSQLTLGPVKVDDIVVGLGTQSKGAFSDPSFQGNVGSGLLKRFVVTFDYGHQIMYLKPLHAPGPDIGTFDRAGFWINSSAKGFKIVDLTVGSSAAAAGLKTNDEITAVDGVPATSIVLSDLRQRLRTGTPGSVVTFTVEENGKMRTVPLTLRDQI